MKTTLAVHSLWIPFLLSLLATHALAKDCVNCGPRSAAPDASQAMQLERNVKATLSQVDLERKASDNRAECMKFEMAKDIWDVEDLLEKLEKSKYAANLKEFWTNPACDTPINITIKVPILFNIAGDPPRMHAFPGVAYEYFVEERSDRETWLKTINTPSTDGMTLLDFMQYYLDKGYNRSAGVRPYVDKIINFVCKNGGVYLKYKSTRQCP